MGANYSSAENVFCYGPLFYFVPSLCHLYRMALHIGGESMPSLRGWHAILFGGRWWHAIPWGMACHHLRDGMPLTVMCNAIHKDCIKMAFEIAQNRKEGHKKTFLLLIKYFAPFVNNKINCLHWRKKIAPYPPFKKKTMRGISVYYDYWPPSFPFLMWYSKNGDSSLNKFYFQVLTIQASINVPLQDDPGFQILGRFHFHNK